MLPRTQVEYITPDPFVFTSSTPVNEYMASAPVNEFVASAHVIEHVASAPVPTLLEPPDLVVHILQVSQVQVVQKTTETTHLQKIVETPEVRSVQDSRYFVSLKPARVRSK